jgi:hypothetical protein
MKRAYSLNTNTDEYPAGEFCPTTKGNIDLRMKRQLITLVAMVLSSALFAQGVYNNGGKIVIDSGVYFSIAGTGGNLLNATNGTDGAISLNGNLNVEGNYTNNVAASDVITSAGPGSKVQFRGSTAQTIGGSTTALVSFPDLIVNNGSGGISLTRNARVNGNLTFTNGLLDIGSSNLTLSPTTTVSGTPSAVSMIVATGTGQLRKEFTTIGSFNFPVGDNTGIAEYSPVNINFTAGTFGAGAYAGVNLVNAAYPDPLISGNYLNRYWNLTQSGITGFNSNVSYGYTPADVTGNENSIYSVLINPAPMTAFSPTDATLHQLATNGLTSFGSYTGANGIRNINMNLFLEGLYNGAGTMRQAQGLLGNQFPGTVADKITIELHDPFNYLNVITSMPNIDLNTNGSASVPVPLTYSGSYYLTVKNRNAIETVSASPITLSTPTLNYNFSTGATQSFGSNVASVGGVNVIYGGDANGDGAVDALDMTLVENDSNMFTSGYVLTDLNGDGVVDALDLTLAENNAINFVSSIHP